MSRPWLPVGSYAHVGPTVGARNSATVVLVSLHIHWGGPREEVDATGKQLIARAAIKAGADAVLGHGPQVVNGIELYDGKPIFYSFGTFAWQFDLERYAMFPALTNTLARVVNDPEAYRGFVTRMTLGTDGKLRRIELLPLQLNKAGNPKLVFGKEGAPLLDKVEALSKPLGTQITRKDWYAVLDLPTAR